MAIVPDLLNKGNKKIMKIIFIKVICSFGLLFNLMAQEAIDPGQAYFNQGHFERAVQYWTEARELISPAVPKKYIDISVQLAVAYQHLGRLNDAYTILKSILPLVVNDNDPVRHAIVLMQLSDIYVAMRHLNKQNINEVITDELILTQSTPSMVEIAMEYLQKAEKISKSVTEPFLLANILNKKGNMFMVQKKYAKALQVYKESVSLSDKAGDRVLSAKTSVNILQGSVESGLFGKIESEIKARTVLQRVKQLSNSHDKAFALIKLAHILWTLPREEELFNSPITTVDSIKQLLQLQTLSKEKNQYVYNALMQALEVATTVKDNYAIAYAKGDLAKLYADEQRHPEAIQLTKNAIYHIQYSEPQTKLHGSPELLYRLEWQLGRFLKANQQKQAAIGAYQRAIEYAKQFCQSCRSTTQSFHESSENLYFEFADLLLQQAAMMTSGAKKQKLLENVVENIELLRRSELRNYLPSCVMEYHQDRIIMEEYQRKITDLPRNTAIFYNPLLRNTAIFYPLLFEERIELLLVLPSGIKHLTVAINAENVNEEANDFVEELTHFKGRAINFLALEPNKETEKYIVHAQKLYNMLIQPITKILESEEIDTLVIVPHGNLLTIPLAALYDGKDKEFLIEKYALAVIPGLKFIELIPLRRNRNNVKVLLGGISKKGNFIELPNVAKELQKIQKLSVADILLNEELTIPNLEAKLNANSYSIIHFSTYIKFTDDLNESYLLTYYDKVTIDNLSKLIYFNKFQKTPIDLIVFSASETALGNKRAALGLAGIAIKAGARSVLASLWNVADKSTSQLMIEFYKQLINKKLSKAQALRKAQLRLLRDKKNRFNDPYFWAPFILIGNWL